MATAQSLSLFQCPLFQRGKLANVCIAFSDLLHSTLNTKIQGFPYLFHNLYPLYVEVRNTESHAMSWFSLRSLELKWELRGQGDDIHSSTCPSQGGDKLSISLYSEEYSQNKLLLLVYPRVEFISLKFKHLLYGGCVWSWYVASSYS